MSLQFGDKNSESDSRAKAVDALSEYCLLQRKLIKDISVLFENGVLTATLETGEHVQCKQLSPIEVVIRSQKNDSLSQTVMIYFDRKWIIKS
tara:strand:- start:287 stop:562 length:276 start_codon:yes stop_codon:yes gene_type:complete